MESMSFAEAEKETANVPLSEQAAQDEADSSISKDQNSSAEDKTITLGAGNLNYNRDDLEAKSKGLMAVETPPKNDSSTRQAFLKVKMESN